MDASFILVILVILLVVVLVLAICLGVFLTRGKKFSSFIGSGFYFFANIDFEIQATQTFIKLPDILHWSPLPYQGVLVDLIL